MMLSTSDTDVVVMRYWVHDTAPEFIAEYRINERRESGDLERRVRKVIASRIAPTSRYIGNVVDMSYQSPHTATGLTAKSI